MQDRQTGIAERATDDPEAFGRLLHRLRTGHTLTQAALALQASGWSTLRPAASPVRRVREEARLAHLSMAESRQRWGIVKFLVREQCPCRIMRYLAHDTIHH